MSESSVAEVNLPPQPLMPCTVVEVRVGREDLRLFVLAAGAGVERWRQIWGPPSGAVWLSWQSLHALGPVTVLHGLPPAPAPVGLGGEREWPHAVEGMTHRRVAVRMIREDRVVHVAAGNGYADLTPEHARELASTLVELAGWAEASDEVADIMRAWWTPTADALQRAMDSRG